MFSDEPNLISDFFTQKMQNMHYKSTRNLTFKISCKKRDCNYDSILSFFYETLTNENS